MKELFFEILSKLDNDGKRNFYGTFAFNLTISVRGIWSDSEISDVVKIEGIKWINELMHDILREFFLSDPELSDKEVFDMILDTASKDQYASIHISEALRMTLEKYSSES